jgi:hypothetical protein
LLALSVKRHAGRDVELQLYSTIDGGMQGVRVKSIRLSNLRVQPLLNSVTECDAKLVTQLGKCTTLGYQFGKITCQVLDEI